MSGEKAFATWEEAVVWLRNQPDQRQLVLDAFYDDPLVGAAERYFQSSEWQAITELLAGRCGTALDVGAGRGIASYALARTGFVVRALEPDPSAIVGAAAIRNLVRQTQLPIRVVEEFCERLPFADAAFDLVFARAVLHHTRDLEGACREMFRVLRPGGMLIAAREHVISKEPDLPQFLAQHPLHHLYGGEHAFLLDRYTGALTAAGFSAIDTLAPLQSPINLFPYTLETLKSAIVTRLTQKVPVAPLWRTAFASRLVFGSLLSMAERFDNRPGRLYSFVCHKA
ncbi:SAM-dependent methyltransferase [Bradyrhizobium japonicum]|uniref:class I SAM-dependent methyltransferase n=1 Tax=Bradyrhizobium elkanii TaxID=29448 RepID=UPI000373A414|nr:class I SAM-dependent methyltransferase [Bradyrhizobium elkanii]MCP1732616.1 SAM-dependent methyltransferase [Bradyrhizobium elkanii]MCS3567954.1 SAM-dependent methyltransferase [Bradyrhizobium elkanii]MCS3590563.1 SAM-dependent methyltransferase [Bradyrhizobium elkanii]MCS3620006.1 SAM-dependent methyltransferase [Bradyrhizobium elkanii]NWL42748.1 class I SAM-dependent methyltransferase [Bradyrhizobium elkanii]